MFYRPIYKLQIIRKIIVMSNYTASKQTNQNSSGNNDQKMTQDVYNKNKQHAHSKLRLSANACYQQCWLMT